MSKERTTRVFLDKTGTVREHRPDGTTRVVEGSTDWDRVAAMSDEDVRRAAEADPDAKPLTRRQLSELRRAPEKVDVRAIRLRHNLSQAAFAQRFGIALDALQDWEQGRRPPNRYARILLTVIDKEPEAVERALSA